MQVEGAGAEEKRRKGTACNMEICQAQQPQPQAQRKRAEKTGQFFRKPKLAHPADSSGDICALCDVSFATKNASIMAKTVGIVPNVRWIR